MHSASFITCFSVEALHSSEIHRYDLLALSELARLAAERVPTVIPPCHAFAAFAVHIHTHRQVFLKIGSHRARREEERER